MSDCCLGIRRANQLRIESWFGANTFEVLDLRWLPCFPGVRCDGKMVAGMEKNFPIAGVIC